MDQNGHAQAIGGVNEKIEGFFWTCKEEGLSGEQGVIIPRANVHHLMLDEEVIDAVSKGDFHIYVMDTVDDALEVLFNKDGASMASDEIEKAVASRLNTFQEKLRTNSEHGTQSDDGTDK